MVHRRGFPFAIRSLIYADSLNLYPLSCPSVLKGIESGGRETSHVTCSMRVISVTFVLPIDSLLCMGSPVLSPIILQNVCKTLRSKNVKYLNSIHPVVMHVLALNQLFACTFLDLQNKSFWGFGEWPISSVDFFKSNNLVPRRTGFVS